MTTTLQDLIDDSIFISTEYQARLAEISDGAEWTVDFSAPSFTLQSDASVSLTPYLLGTESENRGSWIWSWQELGHFPDRVVSAAIQAREGGAKHHISELTTDELPLDPALARKLTLASKALTGIYAHYPVTAGAGVRAWILLDGSQLELEAPTVNRMGQVMAQALQTGTAVNHLRAVDSYAKLRGAHIAWDTEATAVITASDGALRLWFDQGKISGIEAAEPQAGADELARLGLTARNLREQLASERQGIEAVAAQEAADQIAAREEAARTQAEEAAREDEARAEAARAAEAEALAAEQAALEAREAEITAAQERAAAQAAEAERRQKEAAEQAAREEEVEGTITTDRVYPNAEQPYDREPTENARPGRVTTSTIADKDIVREEPAQVEEPKAGSLAAERTLEETEQVEQGTADQQKVEETARPASDIRLAGQAPDLEAERAEAASKPKTKDEKKGFFSRFFGL
ncbi:MAG: hydrolase [Rothia sp. (in: high G+C Gram-positive bacteria)]|nr:hydrolase [Rothia sp. (in: high G+C Gram-positive bacteria)]